MSFISFSQNHEDVILWRALKVVRQGFYIDVGANDPTVDSVTKAFYDRGWHGINIEPLQSHYTDLVKHRPRDINVQIAAGSEEGIISLWESSIRGWATVESEVALAHEAQGHLGKWREVPVKTLTAICEEFQVGEIHFLKVDVEGFEKAVLQGMDFSRFRPWVVLAEATKPNSSIQNHHEWEHILLASEYVHVYFDGLNRFYVAKEHINELAGLFSCPPNVFDEFKSHTLVEAEERASRLESDALNATALANRYASELISIQSSRSWKVTAPLRWAAQQRRLIKSNGVCARVIALSNKIVTRLKNEVRKHPNLKRRLLKIVNIAKSLDFTDCFRGKNQSRRSWANQSREPIPFPKHTDPAKLSQTAAVIRDGLLSAISDLRRSKS